jgi:hypothetical protein
MLQPKRHVDCKRERDLEVKRALDRELELELELELDRELELQLGIDLRRDLALDEDLTFDLPQEPEPPSTRRDTP